MKAARAAAVVALGLAATAVACKGKDTAQKEPIVVGETRRGSAPPAAPVNDVPAQTTRQAPEEPPAFAPFGTPPAPVATTTTAEDAGATDAANAPDDPDLPIIDAARVQAAGCFAQLPPHTVGFAPPTRTAVLTITVVPLGRVTRTEVHAIGPQGGPPEPQLLDCLKRVGNGLTFTSKEPAKPVGAKSPSSQGGEVRSITIDVTVTQGH